MWFKEHALAVIGGIFGVIGWVFVAVAAGVGVASWNFVRGAHRVEGEVVEIVSYVSDGSTMYKPRIKYGEGDEYLPNSGTSWKNYRIGQKVEMLVKGNDAKLNSFMDLWFLVLVFGFLGGVFAAIGTGIMVNRYNHKRQAGWLLKHGRKIEADFAGVGGSNVTVNGQAGWTVLAQWQNPRDNKIYMFTSDVVWVNPESFVQGKKVGVWIDPENPKKYAVDLSFLPEVA